MAALVLLAPSHKAGNAGRVTGVVCTTGPNACAPHEAQVGGGGGVTDIHAPLRALTSPPQQLQRPITV